MAECRIIKLTEEYVDMTLKLMKGFAAESPIYNHMEFDEDGSREYLEKYCNPQPGHADLAFLAILDGGEAKQCIGFLMVSMYKHPCLKGAVTSDELMYVHPDARGLGIGGVMIEEYREWAEFLEADLILLGSSSGINKDFSTKFYGKHGFEPCGMLARYKDVRREDEQKRAGVE